MKNFNTFFQKVSLAFVGASMLLLGTANQSNAQAIDPKIIPTINPWVFEVRAGASIPTTDLADATNTGFDLGLKLGYYITEQVAVRADFESGFLTGQPINDMVDWKNTQLWHYTLGFEGYITDQELTDFRVGFNLGLGGTTITADAADGSADDLDDLSLTNDPFEASVFTVNYGVKVGYAVGEYTDLFVNAMGYTMLADKFPGDKDAVTTFPVTIGMSWRF